MDPFQAYSGTRLAEMGAVVHLHDNGDASLNRCIVSLCTYGQALACTSAEASCTFTCCDVYGNELGDWTVYSGSP